MFFNLALRTSHVALFILTLGTPALAQEVIPPSAEKAFTGFIDFGNRWQRFRGNQDLYRSTVNLGEGPKLVGFNAGYSGTSGQGWGRFFDHARVRASSWGGEPTNTLHVEFGRTDNYEITVNYRRFDYFNSVPSFANPSPGRMGQTQNSLDISRRLIDVGVVFRPGAGVSPFVSFEHGSGFGPGRTTFVQDGNEYAVSTRLDNATNTFRGGASLRFERWSGTIEAGGGFYYDDQTVSFSGTNLGNRSALFLGQRLQLESLEQSYRVDGDDRFARGLIEARPWSKLTLHGQFSFSQPSTTVNYRQNNSGNFVLMNTLQFFTGEETLARSEGVWPHPSAAVGAEFRPTDRLRILETVSTDRFHLSSSAGQDRSLRGTTTTQLRTAESQALGANFTRHRLDVTFDLNDWITLTGGHGYLWANAVSPGSLLAASRDSELRRNQGTAGVAVRWTNRFRMNVNLETATGDDIFFRTDRRRYRRLRASGRYQILNSVNAGASVSLWNNDNIGRDVDFSERSREASADLTFAPQGGRHVTISAGYSRGTFQSDLPFLVPQNFQAARSLYRDRGHSGNLALRLVPHTRLELGLGGNLFISTGSSGAETDTRPTRFYESRAGVSLKLVEHVSWTGAWHWYEYANRAMAAEDFRVHLFSTGIRYEF